MPQSRAMQHCHMSLALRSLPAALRCMLVSADEKQRVHYDVTFIQGQKLEVPPARAAQCDSDFCRRSPLPSLIKLSWFDQGPDFKAAVSAESNLRCLISWTSCSLVCIMSLFLVDNLSRCSACCLACSGVDVRNQSCLVALGVMLQNHLQSKRMALCKKGMSQSFPVRIDSMWSKGTRGEDFSNVKGMQACVLNC